MSRLLNHRLQRGKATRRPAKRFVIFCEGKNTEPEYFRALEIHVKNALLDIEIIPAVGVPLTIADAASKFARGNKSKRNKMDSFEIDDEVWAVFDRDEHPEIEKAIKICSDCNVGIAYSNPCFELWIILHFRDFDSSIGRRELQKTLEGICSDYSRSSGKKPECKKFIGKVQEAEARAEKMNGRRTKERAEWQAPWTTVHELTKSIRAPLGL